MNLKKWLHSNRAAVLTLAIAAVTALLAVIGWITASNNAGDSALGFGTVFMVIGGAIAILIGSYNRFSRILFFPLGILLFLAGYGFAAGGMTKILFSRAVYLDVWGIELAITALGAVCAGLYVRWSTKDMLRHKNAYGQSLSEKITKNAKWQKDITATAVYLGCGSIAVTLVGLFI
jgi:hypothetical protein